MDRDPLDVAWAAGLFEGEGCLTVTWSRKPNGERRKVGHVYARLGSTDLDIVEKFREVIGFGSIHHKYRAKPDDRRKDLWEWSASQAGQVREIIDLFRPYFGTRRLGRANEVYAESLLVKAHTGVRTRCPNGHEYTPENTQYTKFGNGKFARRCRICRRGDARRWLASRRAAA